MVSQLQSSFYRFTWAVVLPATLVLARTSYDAPLRHKRGHELALAVETPRCHKVAAVLHHDVTYHTAVAATCANVLCSLANSRVGTVAAPSSIRQQPFFRNWGKLSQSLHAMRRGLVQSSRTRITRQTCVGLFAAGQGLVFHMQRRGVLSITGGCYVYRAADGTQKAGHATPGGCQAAIGQATAGSVPRGRGGGWRCGNKRPNRDRAFGERARFHSRTYSKQSLHPRILYVSNVDVL